MSLFCLLPMWEKKHVDQNTLPFKSPCISVMQRRETVVNTAQKILPNKLGAFCILEVKNWQRIPSYRGQISHGKKKKSEKKNLHFLLTTAQKKTSINESGMLWCHMARHESDSVKYCSRKSMWAPGSCHSSLWWSKAAQRTRAHTVQSICVHEIRQIFEKKHQKSVLLCLFGP